MEKKNDNKYLLFGAAFLILILLITAFIMNLFNEEQPVTPPKKEEPVEVILEEHEHGADEDKFIKAQATEKDELIKISKFTFSKPAIIEEATVEGTFPVLLDAKKNFLLLMANDNFLYFYDTTTDFGEAVALEVEDAVLSDDGNTIFFTKKLSTDERIYSYNTQAKYTTNIPEVVAPEYGDIKNIAYNNGVVMYSYYDLADNKISKTNGEILSKHKSEYPLAQHETSLKNTSSALTTFNNKFFVYNSSNKSIEEIKLGGGMTTFKKVTTPIPANHFASNLSFNTHGDFFIHTLNSKKVNEADKGHIIVNDKLLTDFKEVTKASWFDNEHLLLLERTTLYLYNVATNEKFVVKTGVNEFSNVENTLYLKNIDMKIEKIEITK